MFPSLSCCLIKPARGLRPAETRCGRRLITTASGGPPDSPSRIAFKVPGGAPSPRLKPLRSPANDGRWEAAGFEPAFGDVALCPLVNTEPLSVATMPGSGNSSRRMLPITSRSHVPAFHRLGCLCVVSSTACQGFCNHYSPRPGLTPRRV